jgi:hypothetical protein
LDRGRNAMGIWQDLVDSHGFGGGYQTCCAMCADCVQSRRRKRERL